MKLIANRHEALLIKGLGSGDANITSAGFNSRALQEAKQKSEGERGELEIEQTKK